MPSLEQIIRPFVVDPTLPPVPVVTVSNDPPPDLVRLNIGIGGTPLQSLPTAVAPIAPLPPLLPKAPPAGPTITQKALNSSFSMSVQYYMTGVVREQAGGGADDPFGTWNSPYSSGGNPFGIGAGF